MVPTHHVTRFKGLRREESQAGGFDVAGCHDYLWVMVTVRGSDREQGNTRNEPQD